MANVTLYKGDCLELMKQLPDKSVDLVLCDLPYGTISSKWDKRLPFDKLWTQYSRIIKPNRAIVLFAGEPFASELRISNVAMYKYDWVWVKNCAAGFVNAKLKPMNRHEMICVFSDGKTANRNPNNMIYHPQELIPYNKPAGNRNKKGKDNTYWRPSTDGKTYIQKYTNYPTTVLHFKKPSKAVHPTQKPVPLLEYLIKTYTNEGETVLDNCMGSGSTGVSCVNTNRDFIGMELDPQYFEIAKNRINDAIKAVDK